MPVHPQVKSFLDMLAGFGGPPLEKLPVEEARKVALGMIDFGGPEEPVADVENCTISFPSPGPAGPIAVRVYRPVPGDKLPTLIYFHGGGFLIGDLDSHDRLCRSLANASACAVIAVDYRLAPEHKYPAAVDDAYAATCYIAEHAAEFRIDPERIAVGGDSAGGSLATVVCHLSRDRGGPRLRYQVLIYPWVDFYDESPSTEQYAKDHFLTRDGLDWFRDTYLPNREAGREPSASPTNAAHFRSLPPALVITAECDPIRDQGEAYARKLQDAGIAVELKRYDGMIHPFMSLAGVVDTAKTAIAHAGAAIRGALS